MTTTPTIEKDHLLIDAMHKHGGSFARSLAEAARHADPENYTRLANAFPEIWSKYKTVAEVNS